MPGPPPSRTAGTARTCPLAGFDHRRLKPLAAELGLLGIPALVWEPVWPSFYAQASATDDEQRERVHADLASFENALADLLALVRPTPIRPSSPSRKRCDSIAHAHLAFGAFGHFCLGAWLARLEAAATVDELLGRMPGFRIDLEHAIPYPA